MQKLYIIGDEDSILAVTVRVSDSETVSEGERLWAELEIDCASRFVSHISSCFRDVGLGNGSYGTSAQNMIERAKMALDGGCLSDCLFSLSVFDWPIENTKTVFSRTPTT